MTAKKFGLTRVNPGELANDYNKKITFLYVGT